MQKIEDRYENDITFYKATNLIFNLINSETDLTPLDIRDACYLARLKFERENPTPICTYDYGTLGVGK